MQMLFIIFTWTRYKNLNYEAPPHSVFNEYGNLVFLSPGDNFIMRADLDLLPRMCMHRARLGVMEFEARWDWHRQYEAL